MTNTIFHKNLLMGMILRFPSRLWFKFYWHKWVLRQDIIGFFGGMPIIRAKYIEYEASFDPASSYEPSEEEIEYEMNKEAYQDTLRKFDEEDSKYL